jgi:hypothetical protein
MLFLPRPQTVKTRPQVKPLPWGKCGCGQTSADVRTVIFIQKRPL